MDSLRVRTTDNPEIKRKAIEDARKVQATIDRECQQTGTEPPPYLLSELIGKGSFGRVYKAASTETRQLVAVKIINIEEGDSLAPNAADTFSDVMKEVNTLKLLSTSGAKNINTVIDALLVGQTVWMVTEFCAGGSVSTLMRPTRGLDEKWIVPILREVAEAIYWIHKQGIIHRDLKCANVFITEVGGAQLGDFGVAGIIETKVDKRSTITGTLHWMAPELFDPSVSYGTEIDIWAFGCMIHEIATGLPPNAVPIPDILQFGSYLRQHQPRLEGDKYSPWLKDFAAFCLVQDPSQRPPIEQVQKHPYIFNTANDYPTDSLSQLVNAYRLWESRGGSRLSLFSAGGAQGEAADLSPSLDEWDFGNLDEDDGDYLEFEGPDVQTVYDVYGPRASLLFQPSLQPPPQPTRPQPRRRRPPNIKALTTPLEKAFDPNTISNYRDNARVFYGGPAYPAEAEPDLPLRRNSDPPTDVRESLIDLDLSLDGSELSQFADLGTIRPVIRAPSSDSDLDRRKTQEWTFPRMEQAPQATDPPPFNFNDEQAAVSGSTHPASPLGLPDVAPNPPRVQAAPTNNSRVSVMSLIDLDASLDIDTSLPDNAYDSGYQLTEDSDAASYTSETVNSPFELDQPLFDAYSLSALSASFGNPSQSATPESESDTSGTSTIPLPPSPLPPSTNVMQGTGSREEVKEELLRMIGSLNEHLRHTAQDLEALHDQQRGSYER